jgi:hypothetical protein
MNDREIKDALRRLDPGAPRADLADRAFRRAMAEGRPPGFVERFAGAGRRLVLGAAAVAAAVWIGLLLRTPDAPVTASGDPVDVVLSVWTGDDMEAAP